MQKHMPRVSSRIQAKSSCLKMNQQVTNAILPTAKIRLTMVGLLDRNGILLGGILCGKQVYSIRNEILQ